jgi:hypothetical protein
MKTLLSEMTYIFFKRKSSTANNNSKGTKGEAHDASATKAATGYDALKA